MHQLDFNKEIFIYSKFHDNWPVDLKDDPRYMIIPYPYPFNNILLLNVGWDSSVSIVNH